MGVGVLGSLAQGSGYGALLLSLSTSTLRTSPSPRQLESFVMRALHCYLQGASLLVQQSLLLCELCITTRGPRVRQYARARLCGE